MPTFREDTKKFKRIQDSIKYCSHCGHSMLFSVQIKRVICSHCGYWIYNRKVDEFKDKILERKRNLENES